MLKRSEIKFLASRNFKKFLGNQKMHKIEQILAHEEMKFPVSQKLASFLGHRKSYRFSSVFCMRGNSKNFLHTKKQSFFSVPKTGGF